MRRVLPSMSTVGVIVAMLLGSSLAHAGAAAAVGESFHSLSPTSGVAGEAYTFTFDLNLGTNASNGEPVQAGYWLILPSFDYSGLTCGNVEFTPALSDDAATEDLAGYCGGFDAGHGLNFATPYITDTAARDYVVTISGLKAPSTYGVFTVALKDWDEATTLGTKTFESGAVAPEPAPVADTPRAAQITIDIDGNGGACSVAKVTGPVTSWATAPTADQCTRAGYTLGSLNTSADGSGLRIPVGGNLHLTGDNRLYAQWADPVPDPAPVAVAPGAPAGVRATARPTSLRVTWTAPADAGSTPITQYRVTATPGGVTCLTNANDLRPRQCIFRTLEPSTAYTFTVAALNQAGWGPASAPSLATTSATGS